MNSDQLIEEGDFKGALDVLRQETSGRQAEPEALLSRFNMEVRLQQFDAAESTMQRLCAAAPEVARAMNELGRAAKAERIAIQRLSDPALATKRETVGLPTPHALAQVKVALAHAQGDNAAAKAALEEVKATTPATSGTLVRRNGKVIPFTNIVDSDDLTGASLPCYEGERLLDIAYSQLKSISFPEPKTSFDVMWPRAYLVLVTGEVFQARIPALYPGSGRLEDKFLRTGQMTMWNRDKGYAEGQGQRDLSLTTEEGNAIVGLLSIKSIEFWNSMRVASSGYGMVTTDHRREKSTTTQDGSWNFTEKAVAVLAGLLAFVHFFRPSIFFSFPVEGRFVAITFGLVLCGCVGWVTSQRSSKGAAAIAVAITFVVTTLKWIL